MFSIKDFFIFREMKNNQQGGGSGGGGGQCKSLTFRKDEIFLQVGCKTCNMDSYKWLYKRL